LKPADRDRGSGQGGSPGRPRWQNWLATFLSGIVAGLIITLLGQWLIQELFHEEPQPRGEIERPARAATVPAGSVAAGSLTDIPDDGHVWLVVRRRNQVWPVGSELGHEPSWERRFPSVLPRGEALSLELLLVGDDPSDRLRSRVGRIGTLPVATLGDFEALASVPHFFVGVESSGSRLYSVFPQAGEAEAFRYENGGGLVNAELPDDPSCHRPSRPVGLRLEWRMSGEQSGGWGVAWDQTEAGSFDASGYKRLALTVRGAAGGETFQIALKDTANEERRVESLALGDVTANGWQELSLPLTDFAPVDLSSLENVSIGFSQAHGSGEICIDEIGFSA
jgi:Complex I intermediate-associated protein 30 (CIA30)